MHQHTAHSSKNDSTAGVFDNITDAFLNAFTKIRKPDKQFVVIRDSVEKFQEDLSHTQRIWNRARVRANGEPVQSHTLIYAQGS